MTDQESLADRVAALEAQVDKLNREVLETRLDDWKARIDQLEVQMHLGQMEARDELDPLLEQLRNRWLDAREQLDRAGSAAGDALSSVGEGVRRSLSELRGALDDAVARLRN